MDVAFVNRMLGLTRGGGEIWDRRIAEEMMRRGSSVTFYVARPLFGSSRDIDDVSTRSIRMPHLRDVAYAAPRGIGGVIDDIDTGLFTRLAASRVSRDHDIVHVTGTPEFGRVVDEFDAPVVLTLHAPPHSFWYDTVNPFASSYDFLSRFDALVGVGTMATTIRERTGLDVTRITPAVDTDRFVPGRLSDASETTFLFVGRFVPAKNLELLLEAFAELADRYADVRLSLVGDGPLRRELESVVDTLGIADCVSFDGYVPHDEVHEYYQKADVFVMSSRSENYPIVLLEAMSCGLPVVAPDIGSISDIVSDGETGYLFERDDEVALRERLEALHVDPQRRDALGGTARDTVEEHFGWDDSAAKLESVFAQVL